MNFAIAAVVAAIGVAMVLIALPGKSGENPAWVRSGLIELMYPVLCLTLITLGVAFMIAG